MNNRELEAAWDYHNRTKHSFYSIRTNPHFLDWENQPLPFKIYSTLDAIPIPQDLSSSGIPALTAVSITGSTQNGQPNINRQILAEILHFSAGVTKRKAYPGGEILFRAAACTGALYHIDLYLITGELSDLKAGVYHFSPNDFTLRKLRPGDYRSVVIEASGQEPSVASAPATLVCASTYWRNSWKYQDRAYRHCFWDSGTILANLLAATAARRVRSRVVVGFVDRALAELLGLDPEREGALTLVPLGDAASAPPVPSPDMGPLHLETMALSNNEVDYPAIRNMHRASSLESREEVATWRQQSSGGDPSKKEGKPSGPIISLRPHPPEETPGDTIEQVIVRRGSTRQFAHESITFAQLSTMLKLATARIPGDFSNGGALNELYLIVNAVDELSPGAYVFHRDDLALELIKEGNFRQEAGHLGLGQEIPADASVDVFFLADLNLILERLGNRGYRAAQLEAGIAGGRLYLSAYAQRLGASGLTFFDDDVTEFFSPHAAGKSVMFLVALGKAMRRTRK